MSDITKCSSWENCQVRMKCRRYTDPDSSNQSYSDFSDRVVKRKYDCSWFKNNLKK
jgi:hypothetical protein